jgi:hypothetical protein
MVAGADCQCQRCGSGNLAVWETDTQVFGKGTQVLQHACSDCHYTWIKCVDRPGVKRDEREDWP